MPSKNVLKITIATLLFSMSGCSSTEKNEEVVMTNEEVSGAQTNSMTSVLSSTDKKNKNFDDLRKQQIVFFDFDNSRIRPAFRDMLRAHASYLIDNKSTKIQIEGHCDERGTPEYNIALGERRAKSVQRYLQSLGV
ncbi:MAG: OmpA family protein, partial [Shewanellaceae bacterium]|nr:OmpA family protein [Shewanellaceae bacterium]